MLEVVVVVAIVVLVIAGFWWTRGYGGMPGGIDDPVATERTGFTQLGDPMPGVGEEHEDREHEVE